MKALMIGLEPSIVEAATLSMRLRWPDIQPMVVQEPQKALDLVRDGEFDVVLLSLDLPGGAAFPFMRQLRATSDVPMVVVTSSNDEMERVKALELGSDDVISSRCGLMELLARIAAVIRRSQMRGPEADRASLRVGDLLIHPASYEVYLEDRPLHLSPTEFRLLHTFMRHRGVVLTHGVLQQTIWGDGVGGTPEVVKKYVQRLRRKLGDDPAKPHWIITVPGVGYRFVNGAPAQEPMAEARTG